MKRKVRRIVVQGHELCWVRSIRDYEWRDGVCHGVESVRVWCEEPGGRRLEILFQGSERCVLRPGYAGHDGEVHLDGVYTNLNLPSTIARLIDLAMETGWRPGQEGGALVIDGVELCAGGPRRTDER